MASNTHFLAGKKIIVSGGGVAGLSFAIALRKLWPSSATASAPTIVIYERDTRADLEGREGYSMSLRSDAPGGIQGLQKLGVLNEMAGIAVAATTNDTTAGFCIWDHNWHAVMKIQSTQPPGLPVGGLRVQRSKMRGVLIEGAAKAGCEVTWGVACTDIKRLEGGRFEIQLSNDTHDVADLVIAADGSRSKLRKVVRPQDGLQYQGINMLGGSSRFEGRPPKPLDQDWGAVVNGSGVALFCSPVDEHSALWSLSWRSSTPQERRGHPLSEKEKIEIIDQAKQKCSLFPPLFSKLLDATDTESLMTLNANDKEPFEHADPNWSGVVFVGDANHAVSPFAGMAKTLC